MAAKIKTASFGNVLAEQLYGDGAFHAVGKFIVHNGGGNGPHLFAGTIVGGVPKGANGNHQMWECEIVVIPIRKFTDGGTFRGFRIDQVLTSQFGKREMWQQPPYWTKQGHEHLWWRCDDCGHEFYPVGKKQPKKCIQSFCKSPNIELRGENGKGE